MKHLIVLASLAAILAVVLGGSALPTQASPIRPATCQWDCPPQALAVAEADCGSGVAWCCWGTWEYPPGIIGHWSGYKWECAGTFLSPLQVPEFRLYLPIVEAQ